MLDFPYLWLYKWVVRRYQIIFEIKLKKNGNPRLLILSSNITLLCLHCIRHLRIWRNLTCCNGFCLIIFFTKCFSIKFLGKDGFLNCFGEPCSSGTFNLFYIISVWLHSLWGEPASLFCEAISLFSVLQQCTNEYQTRNAVIDARQYKALGYYMRNK